MNPPLKHNTEKGILPLHSLGTDSMQINILPLDHTNPYDYKRKHRHTYFEIMLIESGGCSQLVDFKNYVGNDYSCYIICPQQIHLMNRNNSSGTVIQFTEDRITSSEFLATIRQHLVYENSALFFENRPDIFRELQMLINILTKYLGIKEHINNQVVTHILLSIISIIIENKQVKDNSEKDTVKKLLIDFYLLIDEHFSENVGVQFFLEKLETTEKKLAETTKKYTGLTPLQVIHNRILLEAKRLMLFEEKTHKEIGFQLGFDSPSSFSSFIKSKTGLAPIELTKQLSEIHK